VKPREVRHSTASHGDYAALMEYLVDTRGLAAASAVDAKLEQAITSLSVMADRGRMVPALRHEDGPRYREITSGVYRIVYRIVEDEVWIVAIIDRRRQADELLQERAARFQIAKEPP
jgi:toxin ParE1/3/4